MSRRPSNSSGGEHRPDRLPTLLADNNIPQSAIKALRAIGFLVQDAKLEFADRTPDQVLARAAEAKGWIVVTFDKGDFSKMLARAKKTAEQKRFYKAGAIFLKLSQPSTAADRIRRTVKTILCEMENASRRNDRRVFMEIGDGHIKITT